MGAKFLFTPPPLKIPFYGWGGIKEGAYKIPTAGRLQNIPPPPLPEVCLLAKMGGGGLYVISPRILACGRQASPAEPTPPRTPEDPKRVRKEHPEPGPQKSRKSVPWSLKRLRKESKSLGVPLRGPFSRFLSDSSGFPGPKGPADPVGGGGRAFWRQICRVAGRESGSPELLGSPRTSPEVPRTSPEVFR